MTEEDKKEFEEFLEWKKQKEATEGKENSATPSSESIVKTSDEKDKSSQSEVSAAKLSNPSKRDDSSANILLVILGFAIVIAIALIIAFTIGSNSNSTAYADSTEVDTLADEDSFSRYNDDMSGATEGGWSRREETDPMNDSKSVFVSVTSDNTNKLGLPYGDVYATIIVRKMKKYGVDVLIRTSDGQIFGNEYDNENYVTIRFDSNKPIRFYYNTSSDGSSDVVFLRKRAAFIQAAKKANTITVEIPYFQNGRQIFTFTTPKPLDW